MGKRFTIDQIIKILAEAEAPGNSVATTARKYGISEQTIYRWRQKYRGLSVSEAKRLKALEAPKTLASNVSLPKKELEIQTLTEILKKQFDREELKTMLREAARRTGAPLSRLAQRFSIPRRSLYHSSRQDPLWLVDLIQKLAFEHPAWGYRLITAELHRLGHPVNHKRVYRIYRNLRLQKPVSKHPGKKRRKPRPFVAETAYHAGQIWAVDFIHDRLASGKSFRIFKVLDLFSRRAFKPLVNPRLPGWRIAEHLDHLCQEFGPPEMLRRDDGPEFRSRDFQAVLRKWRIREEVIPPGRP